MALGEMQGKRIGELLVADELITADMLEQALNYQNLHGGRIVQALIALGYVSLNDFIGFLGRQPGVASIDLAHYHVPKGVLNLLPKEFILEYEVFPIDKLGKLLTLGMLCPVDQVTIQEVEQRTGLRVKPLLCAPRDIRDAIRRYYNIDDATMATMQHDQGDGDDELMVGGEEALLPEAKQIGSAMKLEQVVQLVRRLGSIPALPETVHRVREAMDDLSITPKQVSEIICHDPAIAAKVLSVANSSAYGFPNRVDSVDLAVALLGLRETYSIVLSSAIMNLFETTKMFDYGKYWEEAVGCAAAAKVMATAFGFEKEKATFTAALLHSIGRLALLETVPELFTQIPSNLEEDSLEAAEMELLGLTHAEAGHELALQWGIPEEIAVPIRFHRHPEFSERFREITAMVGLAVRWTRVIALNGDRKGCLEESKPLLDMLDVDTDLAGVTFDTVTRMEPARFEWDAEAPAPAS